MVTILIAYYPGTKEILDTCLSSLFRHDAGADFKVKVIGINGMIDCQDVLGRFDVELVTHNEDPRAIGSRVHGRLLDLTVPDVDTSYFLTLDSDCFPVADGWLALLLAEYDFGANLPGIVWPWIPSPPDIKPGEIEYRIRKYHCWHNTQVACQLVRTGFVRDLGLKYELGDDTGFMLLDKAHQLGTTMKGLMPTKCPLPEGDLDPEMNRHCCVVFGDKICHQGGATRSGQGASVDPSGYYDKARQRIIDEKGAEWILEDGNHHAYQFSNEEEVAQFKMRAMFREMTNFLQGSSSLF
jgi:hypothetical protein